MNNTNKGIRNAAISSAVVVVCTIFLVAGPVTDAFANDENPSQVSSINNPYDYLEYEIQRIESLLASPDMLTIYLTHTGYALPVQSSATEENQNDSIQVEVDVQEILEQVQEEIREAQRRINEAESNTDADSLIDMNEIMQQVEEALREAERIQAETMQELHESGKLEALETINVQISPFSGKPFVGVVIEDLTFKTAYEKHYDYNYGVLVESVQPGSPADQADVIKGDILMEFDSEKVLYEEVLRNLLSGKSVGDSVALKIFRNGNILNTSLVLMPRMPEMPRVPDAPEAAEFPVSEEQADPPAETEEAPEEEEWSEAEWDEDEWEREWEEKWEDGWEGDFDEWPIEQEGLFEYGYGGGGYLPVWFMPDFSDLNVVIADLGFNELPDYGVLLHGGGGKGPVGNGLFIGGMGAGFGMDRKIQYTINEETDPQNVIRRMKFRTSFGGVTFDKRMKISDKFMGGIGFLIGGGGKTLEISQSSGVYDWDDISNEFSRGTNGYFRLKKNYLVLQPKAMLHYRLTPWLSLRGELGYYMGFSFKNGWEVEVADESFDVLQSPDSNFYDGITFTIGPWFGF